MPKTAKATYYGAFADAVLDAQAAFRGLMDAMARPGRIHRFAELASPPAPLSPAQGTIALTLFDQDTPVHLTPALAASAVASWLSFQTGAPLTADRLQGRFALVEKGVAFPALSGFALGTQDYPDRSTTLIVELEALAGGPERCIAGPGIDGEATMAPIGLPEAFPALWAENGAQFPRGVDLILTAGDACLCLPRTTRLLG
ncbi:phosphonate C-P lyase system protein PhnH [Xaviernesmea oryzae]|uniref:Phosphonate C-P lyase system protein PhnH n=1 Tax=Xaviernesmea oryzae TaxID=464029 RepID=A0A1Q9B2I0_9HYPH|nr:phosphonate C-P lyase system protein PhnH [Xaviernesmea oryzae]OLP62206.1 phosphonate C-P lyase system protein PhnH [Xaviernesmea oryzae]SEL91715.1 alpha-D-ribose 1-methylphosphonate 5-triphosphate synthase subunit PhnH [Xaviernesmea oryzae]